MADFTPQALLQAIRDCGLYKPDQLAALDLIPPETLGDLPGLADRLWADKLVTGYQARKVRLNRLHEVLIGPYLVFDKIGEGGMGKVFKAVQKGAAKTVALKVVRAHLMANPTVVRRYKREAAAAAKLNHPNIVRLLDADEAEGRYYLALEFVYGSDLSRMVKEFGPLPSPEAAEYIRQAALGLQHAHDNNLIHRDIKPSNMLVSGERALPGTGGVATVRILDMGLVRSLEDDDAAKTEVTRDGTVVGTPDYMAPEQAKNSSTVDHRADIYGLGCTLFYLLKGKPPFPDGSPIDKLLRHQLDPPPDLRGERRDVPADMHRLLERMLAKKPEDRVQSAAEVAKLLSDFTAEGLAKVPEIVLTLPDPTPAAAPAARVPDTIATPAVHVLEAEVVTTVAETPKPKPLPIQSKKPVKLVPREADSADSYPQSPRTKAGDSDETRTRSKETEAAAAARRRQAKSRLVEKKRKKQVNWLPLVAGLGGVALLAVVAAVVFLRPAKPATPPADNANNNAPPPVVTRPALPPAWVNVPNDATVLVVAHPDAYWPVARPFVPQQSRYVKAINDLTNRYHFDLRKGERFTFAGLGGRNGTGVATVEGDFLTPDWVAQVEKWDATKVQTIDGQKFVEFRPNGPLTMHGVVTPRPSYSIANNEGLIVDLARRKPAQKPTIAAGLLSAIPDPAQPNPPTFVFAASGGWQFGDGATLGDLGAELVVIQARLVNTRFDVDVEVRGTSKERVIEFVNVALWGKVNKSYPGLKPYLQAITENTANDGWDKVDNLFRLRKTEPGAWSIEDVHVWLEKLLPE